MTKAPFKFFLGIDVAKAKFDVCLLAAGSRPLARATLPNTPEGFAQLFSWLNSHSINSKRLLCVLEATGSYARALEQFLASRRVAYAQVNPAQISFHAKSRLRRTKTDAADALVIADFGQKFAAELTLSVPLNAEQRRLQAWMREMEALIDQRTAAKNRLMACELPELRALIQAQIDGLSQHINALEATALEVVKASPDLLPQLRLLCTIKGIATRTALRILAEIAGKHFQCARQLAAYAGLTPCQRQSGSTVNGPTRLCKTGNARLRTALYLPAQTARRHCLPLKLWGDDLAARGLAPKAVIGAIMRKLTHIIFGVLKHQSPFDPQKLALPTSFAY